MSSKRKFKRDYIILEAKDANFRYKERVLPKAFAKIEVNNDKSVVALYVENLKNTKEGYRVVAIQSDYETIDLGTISLNDQGKGEFILNLENDEADIKAVAILYDKTVPLIGFKGSKIENYEEILFMAQEDEYTRSEDEYEEYEEIEYIEVDEDDNRYEDGEDEYEYEYIEVDEEYQRVDDNDEYEYVEVEEEYEEDEEEYKEDEEYEEYEDYEDDNDEYVRANVEYKSPFYIDPKEQLNYIKSQQLKKEKAKVTKNRPKQANSSNISKQTNSSSQQSSQRMPNKINNKNFENQKAPGALLMPRQIKKGLKFFREAKPFVEDYIDDTRWWKIEINPTTMCGYTMPYLGYVNSLNYTMYSDIIMNSYKYRHYLFGVQYDEYNKRKNYIYAVPGNKEEQPDKGHTGFTLYQPCDNRSDSLGYWLCFIDSRSRRILK